MLKDEERYSEKIEDIIESNGLEEGFEVAYKAFLQSIATGDHDMLEQMCEGNLINSMKPDLGDIKEQGFKFEVLNEDQYTFEL